MKNAIRTLRLWWDEALSIACVADDVRATVRSRRTLKAENKQLAATARTAALARARQGCSHTPPCPPATAPDRTTAAEVYADGEFVYLCNGIVLTINVPGSPSGINTAARPQGVTP